MSTTPPAGTPDTVVSAVDALLAGPVEGLERFVIEGLEVDFARPAAWSPVLGSLQLDVEVPGHDRVVRPDPAAAPAREPDERAVRLAERRAARAAALREQVEARFVPGTDSSRMWALALGLVDAPLELDSRVAAPDLLADLARLDRDVDRAHGRRYAAIAAIAGIRAPGAAVSSENDRQIAHEVAIALGMSKDAAARHIATARSLFEEFAPFGHALLDGTVSDWHARTLIAECLQRHRPRHPHRDRAPRPPLRPDHGRRGLPDRGAGPDRRARPRRTATPAAGPRRARRLRPPRQGRHVLPRTHPRHPRHRRHLRHPAPRRRHHRRPAPPRQRHRSRPRLRARVVRRRPARRRLPRRRPHGPHPGNRHPRRRGHLRPGRRDRHHHRDRHRPRHRCTGWPTRPPSSTTSPHPPTSPATLPPSPRSCAEWSPTPSRAGIKDYGTTIRVPPALRRHCIARDGGCRSPGCTRKAASATCRSTTPKKHPTAPPPPATADASAPNATNARQPASSTSPTPDPTDPRPSTRRWDRRSASPHARTSPDHPQRRHSPSRSSRPVLARTRGRPGSPGRPSRTARLLHGGQACPRLTRSSTRPGKSRAIELGSGTIRRSVSRFHRPSATMNGK